MNKNNQYYMRQAMKLALKGKGKTSPNPMVGAVLVKHGKIVATGYHKKAGSVHAEVMALEQAGSKAEGACLYVTLEPCAHYGRTPPCIEAIIRSKIKKVVVGMIDPNPLNNTRGVEILKQNGIKVEVGVMEDELRKLNEVFIKYITRNVPFITVKIAQSLDGKIATRTGDSKWITSDRSRAFAHQKRAGFDAIMVGVNTVLRDNPYLDPWFSQKELKKIIVDSQLSTPPGANIFKKKSEVIIVTLPVKPAQETQNRGDLSSKARILEVKESQNGQVNLRDALKKLARLQITNILVEGGGTLVGSLFDEKLVDKIMFFTSPKIIGGKEAISSVMGKGIEKVQSAFKLKDVTVNKIGEDFLFQAYV
ncbi:MAG: bifunctional diaminohydroxyphosphoribosylaminopyrimidine deaminase/5-amino-6-(5-phosphoribosylamino)uracil reductase RibD [Candidatus Omnitrophica bacterium]|jgi:diaminohydroxyphosphoribosylaminopyrimidine deaminase/5-amino-6-(5-phosphoribosylamino)uracil reductase|nr:bifunctional diaminohydroxyphosphoribosylaminopyrimidine deaminase/5-amino-6-(5-phosphoribosylamino)uracil reductase RibD [Candidatus Omnitrophota bacterium]